MESSIFLSYIFLSAGLAGRNDDQGRKLYDKGYKVEGRGALTNEEFDKKARDEINKFIASDCQQK